MSASRPKNSLFIISDQHTGRAMSCRDHAVVKTPHLDALAERGTLFTDAYCNGPICVPSRASLATGRHVHDIEKWDNCKPYIGEEPSWAHRLGAAGKPVTSIGKLHYRNETDPTGFVEQIVPMHILEGVGMLYTICRDPMPVSRKFVQLVDGAGGGESTYTEYDRDITARTVRWLREQAPRHEGGWGLFVSLVCPHPPWVAPEQFYAMYPHEDVDLPEAYGLDERPMHPGLETYRQFFGVKDAFDEATLRKVTAAYYGMISYLDDNIGQILAALDASGQAEDTCVVYTSDHGESMGHKGMFSKCNMYQESVGIPMILAGPDVPRANVVSAPAQLLDVFPTMLHGAGVAPTDEDLELPGTDLHELAGASPPARTIVSQQHSAGAGSAVYMVRAGQYKYVHYAGGLAPQLFDLAADPLELSDLSADPAHAAALAAGEAALREVLDPDAVDARAKADQRARLEAGGGEEAIVAAGSQGYTPAPGEKPVYV